MTGTVKEYDKVKGFGFISGDDGEDYFVHIYGLGPKLKNFGLRTGQKVIFDVDFGVLDVDSKSLNQFNIIDKIYLEKIVRLIEKKLI